MLLTMMLRRYTLALPSFWGLAYLFTKLDRQTSSEILFEQGGVSFLRSVSPQVFGSRTVNPHQR